MRRKDILTILSIIILSVSFGLFGCGGGGGGSTDVPRGENPGIPTVVQVQPTQYVAQTNSTLFINAKVLDGNGLPSVNTPVVFTNLSLTGGTPSTVRAITDAEGIARTTMISSTPGFATIQAEISSGSGNVRDIKTVFFSSYSRNFPGPTMRIDIDGDADGIFNEPDDFIIFENPNDRQILVRATVLDPFGQPVVGENVRFGADSSEAIFPIPLGDSALTDNNGQAIVLMEISPQALRPFAMTINVFAIGDFSGAANLVSIFLQPITVSSVVVSASPNPVESGDESQISVVVTTSTGAPAPNGTAVNFRTTNGGIDPFSSTTNGVATVTFKAPVIQEDSGDLLATITATVGGVQGLVRLIIQAPPVTPTEPEPPATLSATPGNINITGALGGTAVFTIAGGTPPYGVTSSNPGFPANPTQVSQPGGTFSVTVPPLTTAQTVTYTIVDGGSQVKTVTLTIQ